MKFLFILILGILLGCYSTHGQEGPPNTRVDCEDYREGGLFDPTNTVAYWDWRDNTPNPIGGTLNYQFWQLPPGGGPRIVQPNASPFFALNDQPNTREFAEVPLAEKDFKVEDGWELSYKFFGENLPNQSDNYTNTPMFALYNIKTGLMRFFIMPTSNESSNNIAIKLFFNEGEVKSAIFSHVIEIPSAIEKFENDIEVFALNQKTIACQNNQCRTWYYADVQMAYDPCLCYYKSSLDYEITLISNTTVKLSSNGRLTPIIENGGSTQKMDVFQTLIGVGSTLIGAGKAGAKAYKSGEKFRDDANEFIANHVEYLYDNKLLSSTSWKKVSAVFKVTPKIGAAIAAASFLYSGIKKLTGENKSAVQIPPASKIELSTNGVEETLLGTANNRLKVMGSGSELSGKQKPAYDRIPGIVSLLKSPKLEYVEYSTDRQFRYRRAWRLSWLMPWSYDVNEYYNMPLVREFRVAEDPIFAVNPASGLEIESIEASLHFENPEIPNLTGPDFKDIYRDYGPYRIGNYRQMNQSANPQSFSLGCSVDEGLVRGFDFQAVANWRGLEIESMMPSESDCRFIPTDEPGYRLKDVKFVTPTVDWRYLRNQTVKLLSAGKWKFYIKFKIYLKDKNPGIDKVYLNIVSYQIHEEDIYRSSSDPGGLKFYTDAIITNTDFYSNYKREDFTYRISGIDPSPFQSTSLGIIHTLDLSGQNVSSDQQAAEKIIIGIETTFTLPAGSNSIIIKAREIEVLPGAELPPYVTLIPGYPVEPLGVRYLATSQEIVDVCTGNMYRGKAGLLRLAVDNSKFLPSVVSNTKVGFPSPNPTRGSCSLPFDLAESGGYEVFMSNSLGLRVKEIAKNGFTKAGSYTAEFYTSDLEAGVYYITFSSNGFRQSRKLVVVK